MSTAFQPQGEGKYSFPSIGCEQKGEYVVSKTVSV